MKSVLVEAKAKGFPEEPLLAATQSHGVILKSDYEFRTVEAQKSLETLKLVEVGDFVISLRSFQGGIERSRARGIISPAYTILRAAAADGNFLALLFKSQPFIRALQLSVTGIREGQNIDYAYLAREWIPVPPADEQAAIVKYLGHAHARIDRAIAAKRKLIALLEEQKQAIIHQAVTRGLDPDVPLKDSGIPWLGPIPAYWGTTRAKYLFQEFDRRSGTGQEPLLSLRLASGLVRQSEVSAIEIAPESLTHYKVVAPGDLVMNRMRAATGLFAVSTQEGLVSPDYATMRVAECVDSSYFIYLFKTRTAMAEFRRRSTGLGTGEAGFMRLYSDEFGRISMPLPPLSEQNDISRFVRESAPTMAADKVGAEIALLHEFRSRLTSDVVTGQVDVREIASTLPEITAEQLAEVDEPTDLLDDAEEYLDEAALA